MGKFSTILEKSGLAVELPVKTTISPRNDGVYRENDNTQPIRKSSWDERFLEVMQSSNHTAEAFRMLRSRILHPDDEGRITKTIMVTSSAPSEGKSFVSCNLGVSIAQGLDQHALIVDCDLRRPTVAKLFGLPTNGQKGLADYLKDTTCELPELLQRTSLQKLSILPSGKPPENPAELLASSRMMKLVHELSGRYSDRFIIFDSPPFQVASESIVLSREVDGVVLVVGYGKSDRNLIKKMVEVIDREKIIGVVFNGMKSNILQERVLDAYGSYGQYYSYTQKQ